MPGGRAWNRSKDPNAVEAFAIKLDNDAIFLELVAHAYGGGKRSYRLPVKKMETEGTRQGGAEGGGGGGGRGGGSGRELGGEEEQTLCPAGEHACEAWDEPHGKKKVLTFSEEAERGRSGQERKWGGGRRLFFDNDGGEAEKGERGRGRGSEREQTLRSPDGGGTGTGNGRSERERGGGGERTSRSDGKDGEAEMKMKTKTPLPETAIAVGVSGEGHLDGVHGAPVFLGGKLFGFVLQVRREKTKKNNSSTAAGVGRKRWRGNKCSCGNQRLRSTREA